MFSLMTGCRHLYHIVEFKREKYTHTPNITMALDKSMCHFRCILLLLVCYRCCWSFIWILGNVKCCDAHIMELMVRVDFNGNSHFLLTASEIHETDKINVHHAHTVVCHNGGDGGVGGVARCRVMQCIALHECTTIWLQTYVHST